MNKIFVKGLVFVFVVSLSALLSIQAGECAPPLFTDQELDDLLAPIALYPDPLLAEILPASTYPEEVADAAAWLRSGGEPSRVDEQNWDDSVKAVAHYPNILFMMSGDMDWTAGVGDAFLNQPEDVTKSIQRLRWRAKDMGNLVSNNEQTVAIEDDYIQIVPAQPQYIYVPEYDPAVVYIQRPAVGIAPFITFGFGLAIGGWLSMDFDWGHHHVIYHGWNRHGWVNNARPYVHVTNVYINRSRPYINQSWRHDASHGDPDRYRASRPGGPSLGKYTRTPDARGRVMTPSRPSGGMFGYKRDAQTFSNRGRESLGAVRPRNAGPPSGAGHGPARPAPSLRQQVAAPPPSIRQQPAAPAPKPSSSISQPGPGGGGGQPGRTPSVFGGYRGANEARTQSLRGQASRQSSVAAPRPSAPVSRGNAPAGKMAPKGKPGPPR